MTDCARLAKLSDVAGPATLPAYDPADHLSGIVHLGVGAFHRAHQAVYTDTALAAAGGDWRITGVSLRSVEIADALNAQNGLYTVIERAPSGATGRVIGSLTGVIAAARDRAAPLMALIAPETRVVTLTITEKAYGIDRLSLSVDDAHPAIRADLANPRDPTSAIGLISEALRLRREKGLGPFTVLSCDNLPDNGGLLRAGVVDFSRRTTPGLGDWIENVVAFPASMVDRITPAGTSATQDEARRLIGCDDLAAVETEPFSQWVIEDRFTAGRPDWEAGGAVFVDDVGPYELMKLRMLNGTHSMLAYAGFLSGCSAVRDVMAYTSLAALVDRHMQVAATTLPPMGKLDLNQYRQDLSTRFANPAIAHQTYQIAMDGTEKLPQRILAPAAEILRDGGDVGPYCFAVAAWMRYCLGKRDDGTEYDLRDPREQEIAAAVSDAATAESIANRLHRLPGLFHRELADNARWRQQVARRLGAMLKFGMADAIEAEADGKGKAR